MAPSSDSQNSRPTQNTSESFVSEPTPKYNNSTIPKRQEYSEWEEKKLEEVLDFLPTANNSRADLSENDDISYVHYGDIHTKFNMQIDFSKAALPKIAPTLYKNAAFLENGDLIISDASEDTTGIAKSVEVKNLQKIKKQLLVYIRCCCEITRKNLLMVLRVIYKKVEQ